MIAALYVDPKGVYSGRPDVECWGLPERDAREYAGPWPVVAHPPCARWSALNNLVLCRYPHRASEFAHGNDGGCFAKALDAVRAFGGVLEHPAQSRAWWTFDLPAPGRLWQRGICGGWAIELDQVAYGHQARKRTWLYAFGVSLPAPAPAPAPTGKVVRAFRVRNDDGTWSRRPCSETNREISTRAASATPPAFAELLLSMARTAQRQAA